MNFIDKVISDIENGDFLDIDDTKFEFYKDVYDHSLFSSNYNYVHNIKDRWFLTFKISPFWPVCSSIPVLERDGMRLDLDKDEKKRLRKAFLKAIDYKIQRYYDRKRKAKEWSKTS